MQILGRRLLRESPTAIWAFAEISLFGIWKALEIRGFQGVWKNVGFLFCNGNKGWNEILE
ncbi:hypothetical protein [Bifidobacterium animalis]|uniref:hypothetical protein n=1 Tax=Bifidobacterium animalis TaxID=28025 RepID=UPI00142FCA76|nr:hypothetical protein [Bifidobacterium animalis]